jgi:two-component system NtrC family sensor kinase
MSELRQLAELEVKLQVMARERDAALEQQAATAGILKVIARSPADVQPVFEAIATNANRLLGGFSTAVFRFIDGHAHLMAFTPTTPAADEVLKSRFPRPTMAYEPFELIKGGDVVQVADAETSPPLREIARARGFRSMLFTPLVSRGAVIGAVSVTRKQPGAFAADHVDLIRTFADQAVIAIDNARLFEEVQAKSRDLSESLQQQTATSEVLEVISNSSGDLQPVFDAMLANATRIRRLAGARAGHSSWSQHRDGPPAPDQEGRPHRRRHGGAGLCRGRSGPARQCRSGGGAHHRRGADAEGQ